jgi:DNA mismatch repair protein MutS
VPLAGVPVKAVTEYLRRLVQKGYRVAICEQVEDPRLARGIVRREVVETVTPGAAFADDLLDGERHNYLCAVHVAGKALGIAAIDVSTGAFRLVVGSLEDAPSLLARLSPREILMARGAELALPLDGAPPTEREPWSSTPTSGAKSWPASSACTRSRASPEGALDVAIATAGAVIRYLRAAAGRGPAPHAASRRGDRATRCRSTR